jgi:hypothetical protein
MPLPRHAPLGSGIDRYAVFISGMSGIRPEGAVRSRSGVDSHHVRALATRPRGELAHERGDVRTVRTEWPTIVGRGL